MNRSHSRELVHRIEAIKEGLEIQDSEIMAVIQDTIDMDQKSVEDIIRAEGSMIAHEDFIYSIENIFLSSQTLQTIREHNDEPSSEWAFLKDTERTLINNTIKLLKKTSLEYQLSRAELMILRKEVIDFVQSRLRKINSNLVPGEIINLIIQNYSYIDSLKNLGFYKNQEGYLEKYFLDENLVYKKK